MKKLNLTPGEAKIDGHDTGRNCINVNTSKDIMYHANFLYGAGISLEEAIANATLYTDAHNTYNKCSKLPSELLEENTQRLDKIRSLTHLLKRAYEGNFDIATKDVIEEALQWLTKIENNQ